MEAKAVVELISNEHPKTKFWVSFQCKVVHTRFVTNNMMSGLITNFLSFMFKKIFKFFGIFKFFMFWWRLKNNLGQKNYLNAQFLIIFKIYF